jgi:hypothetical protein
MSELIDTTDPVAWAAEFDRVARAIGYTTNAPSKELEAWLIGWFANAIMTGRRNPVGSMGAYAQEELRRAAYPVASAIADGYAMDPGLTEMIHRLALVLDSTNGWRPDGLSST